MDRTFLLCRTSGLRPAMAGCTALSTPPAERAEMHVRFEKGSQTPRLQGKLCGLLGSKGHTAVG